MEEGKMEKKTGRSFATKILDEDAGIVETVFAVFGNVDEGHDVIHPGAFTKTFAERGHRVRVLDAHRADSVLSILGKPLSLREVGRDGLPPEVVDQFPEATGGAKAEVQFLLDTPEGAGAFARIKAGALDEWSFGYDALDKDYSKAMKGDREVTVRNLRTLKMYELSPVLWGMNQATRTLSAKAGPAEEKPWRAIEDDDGKWRVYKLADNGDPTGDALGEHETEEEAQAQVRALYVNTDKAADEAFDDRMDRIRSAFRARNGGTVGGGASVVDGPDEWIEKIYPDRLIVRSDGQLLEYPYTDTEETGVTFGGPVEVEVVYQPKRLNDEDIQAIADKVAVILQETPAPDEPAAVEDQSGAGPAATPPTDMMDRVAQMRARIQEVEG
jgi:HK97 family phage prohead protease